MKALKLLPNSVQGRGALFTIAVMFFLSGVLRVWDGADAAIADGTAQEPHPGPSLAACACEDNAGLAAALDAVRAREARLDARELALQDRSLALNVAETTVQTKLDKLLDAEAKLAATMARSEVAAEEDLSRLTAVYENMKAKEAAAVFSQMAPEFAAGFLGRMRSDAAAAILSGLDPETAYTISVLIAGRNANAPTE